jgi:hypothetical protein
MKPREFDELVRQKFDQNDFAYSPKNWDQLAEQLDGRAKKRSMIMWLWMPALGMAASVALAIGVSTMIRYSVSGDEGMGNSYAHSNTLHPKTMRQIAAIVADVPVIPEEHSTRIEKSSRPALTPKADNDVAAGNSVGIKLKNVLAYHSQANVPAETVNLALVPNSPQPKINNVAKPKPVDPVAAGYNTFKKEAVAIAKKPAKFSIILSGAVNQGNQISGYAAGATVRRMINEKVYVEGDVAFSSSDLFQRNTYISNASGSGAGGGAVAGTAAKPGNVAAKVSKVESSDNSTFKSTPDGPLQIDDKQYNLRYLQLTPSVGYKILKRMSIAAGPDFQQVLAGTRPDISDDYRGNKQQAALFDVGFIGKTEYALTKRVKAAVAYRKGINSIISPNNIYIDHDYLQFQVKCTVFNK